MRHAAASLALSLALALAVGAACSDPSPTEGIDDLVFAAVQGDGTLAILDARNGALLATVDLSEETHHGTMTFEAHNVQAAASGRMVWLTAMPAGAHGDEPMLEQLIGVDVDQVRVVRRIELGVDLHVAHVVLLDSTAWVTATDADQVLVVDLAAGRIDRTIALPAGTGPHGARLTPDGGKLVVAGMGAGSIEVVDLIAESVTTHPLPAPAIQTAVLPDGSAAFATIYATRQVARLDLASGAVTLFDLPSASAGPAQIYPAPDSGSVWVADQGYLGGDPAGSLLIRVAADSGLALATIPVAGAPHGLVVSPDGATVWTTTLVDGVVQAVDVQTYSVATTTVVGREPNGISLAFRGGAMP